MKTCSPVLNMHVALLTTPSLRNISITHSVSLGKGWESFLKELRQRCSSPGTQLRMSSSVPSACSGHQQAQQLENGWREEVS